MSKSTIRTEADALRDILDWSKGRPIWQRDALRRLLENGELTDADISELTELCKDSSKASEVLAEGHISEPTAGASTIALKQIGGVQNVNALAERQNLTFLRSGVTIVYGDNGSGKSGYVRILKQSCQARYVKEKEKPLPNAYKENTGTQRAELEYFAEEQRRKTTWTNDQPADSLLKEINIFDSQTANVQVEEANGLVYSPFPMKILERLAKACTAIKETIEGEIEVLEEQTPHSISKPSCSPQTEVGHLIEKLSKDTNPEAVNQLAQLSGEETDRLTDLTSHFANDPEKETRKLRAQKARIEGIREKLTKLHAAASRESAEKLKELSSTLNTKTAAARVASDKDFKNEPLDGIGSDTWRALWEAARAYSTVEAYPDKPFPVIDEEARCVLCLQELGDEASSRLQRFEAFVQDHTQKEKDEAEREMSEFLNELRSTKLSYKEHSEHRLFLADELSNDQLASAYRTFTIKTNPEKRPGRMQLASAYRTFTIKTLWRLRGILRAKANVDLELPALADVGLNEVIDSLETRAKSLLAEDESDERKALRKELDELKDRKWLSGVKGDVLAQIERLKKIDVLVKAQKDASSTTVTTKNTGLSKMLVTEKLRESFAEEVKKLELKHLAIELKQASSKSGGSRFQIRLSESKSAHNVGKILSEGEFRCIALAGFLADLATNDNKSGIIFDDPVSSLDHIHRQAIAKRLADEGRRRQVIVFTHDLSFLFLLNNACVQHDDPEGRTEFDARHIQKKADIPGYCRNEHPNQAQKVSAQIEALRNHLANTKFKYEKDPYGMEWLITARGLIDSLRQAWETAVEETISPVVRRFSHKVDTRGFIKLSAITEEDARKMRKHYANCSIPLHDSPSDLRTVLTPDQIKCELNALDKWLEEIQERQNPSNTS